MRLLVILGGMIGFGSGVLWGWFNQSLGAEALWRASVAALAAGFLMRWWGKVWIRSLQQSLEQSPTESSAPTTGGNRTSLK